MIISLFLSLRNIYKGRRKKKNAKIAELGYERMLYDSGKNKISDKAIIFIFLFVKKFTIRDMRYMHKKVSIIVAPQ